MTRILCLDDDSEMLALIRMILTHEGYDIVTTTNDFEAWDTMHAEPIDLLTQDFMRPGLGGWTLVRFIRSDPVVRHIPVLGVSAGPRDVRADQLRSFGLDLSTDLAGYMTKPYDPRQLLDAIASALAKRGQSSKDWPRWRGVRLQPIEACTAALLDADRTLRHEAAWALGWSKDIGALEPLVRALSDEDADVRVAVVNALALLGDRRAVAPLMELLSDGQSDVRWSTALALGALGDPLAVERLGQVLQDKTWDRRRVAAAPLAEINSERSVEILIAALRDQDADVAWSAAYALWRLSDARALPELEHVMREDTRQASHGEPLAKLARKAIERIDLIRIRQQDRAPLRRFSGDSQYLRLRPSQG